MNLVPVCLAIVAASSSSALAANVPFTEDFSTDAANWFTGDSAGPLSFSATGGPDGPNDSFVSGTLNFANAVPGSTPIAFRGQDNFGSSNGAFAGNWITGGVSELSFSIRHNGPVPIPFFVRYAGPGNPGPAAISLLGAPVLPNTWTDIVVPIDPSEFFIFEGPLTFESVFSSIARLQIGVLVDAPYAGLDADFTFDIDDIAIIPSPAVASLFAVGSIFGVRKRRCV